MILRRVPEFGLIDRLPVVRGRYSRNVSLAGITWFRVGGPADVMFRPADRDDLIDFLKYVPSGIDVMVMGVGSNLLVRDGGVDGVVIRLGRGFTKVATDNGSIVAGAGALDVNVSLAAGMAGIAGFEFLSGIPGTIGGALRMNAGAYDSEIKDVLVEAEAVTPDGEVMVLKPEEMKFSYRRCGLPEDWVFTQAKFRGREGSSETITGQVNAIRAARQASQPVRARTGGSTFANPEGTDLKAWQLIDQAGCRGLKRGDAQISEQHCNFLINTDQSTAADLESLGEEVRRRVAETSGVTLRWEIRRVGRYNQEPADIKGGGDE